MKRFGYLLALLLSAPAFAAGPPPVDYPQACAPTYCVQVTGTVPDQPKEFVIQHDARTGAATMIVDMGRGFFVAFSSQYVELRLNHTSNENRWTHRDDNASAWTCLKCGTTRGKDEVLGIVLRGIPPSYHFDHLGLSVCVWPLDMSAAGYGDGRSMRLDEKICISAHGP